MGEQLLISFQMQEHRLGSIIRYECLDPECIQCPLSTRSHKVYDACLRSQRDPLFSEMYTCSSAEIVKQHWTNPNCQGMPHSQYPMNACYPIYANGGGACGTCGDNGAIEEPKYYRFGCSLSVPHDELRDLSEDENIEGVYTHMNIAIIVA